MDLRKEFGALSTPTATHIDLVDIPELVALTVTGQGDPNSSVSTSTGWKDAVEALYAVAYGVRSRLKSQPEGIVCKVMPLEGQWSLPDGVAFSEEPRVRALLRWKALIVQPPMLTSEQVSEVISRVARKKHLPAMASVQWETLPAIQAAQTLHVGSFADEPGTLERLHAFLDRQGLLGASHHHEIYLSDPRRVDPQKLRTILRIPILPN